MAVDFNQLAQQDTDYFKQAAAARQAEQDQQAKTEPSFLQQWTGAIGRVTMPLIDKALSNADLMYATRERAGRDVAAGATTGAVNIADAAKSAVTTSASGGAAAEDPANAVAAMQPPSSPIWDHAKQHILDFRDAVAVKDPTLADNLLQGVSQLAIPFAGYSRALAGLHGVANMVAAGGLTDATALGPHDMRMADLIALGRHTEGKLGDVLRTLAPDGSAVNAYINFLADRKNETEAEGRFKNVLDGFGVNMVATPLMHAAGVVLKQGASALRSAIEAGAEKISDFMPPAPPAAPAEK